MVIEDNRVAGSRARCTTGHLIPIDGGLTEGFLR
jgi:hypothetical protein